MSSLLYLSYGTGPHEQEVICSALSAHHWTPIGTGYNVLVYTDHPESYRDYPFQIEFISTDQWDEWAGPRNFNHRRKILALQHALQQSAGPVVLLDGDTWLRAPVAELFQRVGERHTVMHIREGAISKVDTPLYRDLSDLLSRSDLRGSQGNAIRISPDEFMYNAGVVGIDPADIGLLCDVLDLTDQLCEVSELHVMEQFAFSYVLVHKTDLHEADDLVFHYWPPYLHDPFRMKLAQLMTTAEKMTLDQKADFLFTNRPRPSWSRRGKVIAKRALQMAGIIRGRCRSNEW